MSELVCLPVAELVAQVQERSLHEVAQYIRQDGILLVLYANPNRAPSEWVLTIRRPQDKKACIAGTGKLPPSDYEAA